MSDKITDAEIVADLDQAIARMENSDASWACVDAMKAARARLAAAPDGLAVVQRLLQVETDHGDPTGPEWDAARAFIATATGT